MKKRDILVTVFLIFISTNIALHAQIGGGSKNDLYYRDADGDGYGDPNISTQLIPVGNTYVDNADDCDDTDPNIGTGSTWYIDTDGDGFGESTLLNLITACTQPAGYVANNLDQCPNQYGLDNGCPGQTGVSSDQNYIHTTSYLKPLAIGQENNASVQDQDKIENITYFDGLGRPKQKVAIRAGGNNEDIVTHIEYDVYGRQSKEYLPYAAPTNQGAYRTNASSSTYSFYATTKYENTNNPYSEKIYEASPLHRILEQTAPGTNWKKGTITDANGHSNGHSIKFAYKTNTTSTEVRLYTVQLTANYIPSLQSTRYYGINKLYKTITKDENWKTSDANNRTIEEFKDKQGRVVLKRTYNNNQKYDTYYVYDDYGNLTYVLPPKAEATTSIPTSQKLNELCYQYIYDNQNRLIKKKIPGKGWEYIVYDNLDRPVLTQDANQRTKSPHQWLFTKYDALGRVAYRGIYKSNSSQSSLQNIFTAKSAAQNYETKTSNSGYGGSYYTNTDFPYSNIEILSINYYDTYTFNRRGAGTSVSAYGITSTSNIKGLATGTRIKVLGISPEKWITTVNYYDTKGRPFYTYTKNDYLSTTDIVKSKLDYFTGRILEITTQHTKSGQATITTVDKFSYDLMGRQTKQTQIINNNTQFEELIAENTYDELGQLIKKGVGNLASDPTNRLQKIDYTYTVRGWLKQINDINNLGTSLFSFSIEYDGASSPLYNGNISKTQWRTANTDTSLKSYTYTYDHLNRIKSAIDNTNHYNLTNVSYDKNGNITDLSRKGHINANATSFGVMDNLKYYYQSNSNKLAKVKDLSYKPYGFKDGTNSGNDYTYDPNGNLKNDANKNITSILYNHLNLPTEIKFNNSNTKKITYFYDASGTKLRKVVNDNGSITTTDYASNGAVYENNVLQFVPMPEGYVTKSGNNFQYVYQYKDHLGNIRLSYSDSDGNGSISQSEIIEESNYYPFGLQHKGYNNYVNPNGNAAAQRFKFQGQEFSEELNLNNYEFGLRQYDASLGRWFSTDPYEQFDSPYVAMGNNPVVSVDPDGGYCYDANGNQITCPDSDIFDEYRDDKNNNTTILPEATPGKDDNDSNSNDDSELNNGDKGKVFEGTRKEWFDIYVTPLREAAANKRKEEWLDNWRRETVKMQKGALEMIGVAVLPIDVFEMIGGRLAAKVAVREGRNWVYISKNAKDAVDYVGITNNLLRRAAEHLRGKGIIIRGLKGGLSRADARAVEQALIEIHKLGKNGGSLMNKINSISPSNPIYARSLERGFEILKAIGYKIK